MIHLLQLYKMLDSVSRKLFIQLFNDLSYEIDDLGYKGMESELIEDLLFNHFAIELEDTRQIERLTKSILRNQNRLNILERLAA